MAGDGGAERRFSYDHGELYRGQKHFHAGRDDLREVVAELRAVIGDGMPYGHDQQAREFDKGYRQALEFLLGGDNAVGEVDALARLLDGAGTGLGLTSRNISEADDQSTAALQRKRPPG